MQRLGTVLGRLDSGEVVDGEESVEANQQVMVFLEKIVDLRHETRDVDPGDGPPRTRR